MKIKAALAGKRAHRLPSVRERLRVRAGFSAVG